MKEEVERRKRKRKMTKNTMEIAMREAEVRIGTKRKKRKKIKSVDLIPMKKITEEAMLDCCHL
jgi:hypothetical protein